MRWSSWNRLHPSATARHSHLASAHSSEASSVLIVAVTDFMKSVADQVARFVGAPFAPPRPGTDGFGRSDTREALRRHFEIDAEHIVVAVLSEPLAAAGEVRRPRRSPRRSPATASTPRPTDPRRALSDDPAHADKEHDELVPDR